MFFVNEFDKPVDSSNEKAISQKFFVFDLEQEDYLLRWSLCWDILSTTFFTIEVCGKYFKIPSGTYLLCGCEGGSQDWIVIDEIIGRPIDIFIMNKHFKGWTLAPMKIVDVEESSCYIPMGVKTPMPVMDSTGQKVIVVSQYDHYHKLKDKEFDIFFL